MIANINGNPYTTAAEDLLLKRIKARLKAQLQQATQEGLRLVAKRGEIRIDMRSSATTLAISYALGRAQERCTRDMTVSERARLQDLIQELATRLGNAAERLAMAGPGQTVLDVSSTLALVDQAYFAGREDGAGR